MTLQTIREVCVSQAFTRVSLTWGKRTCGPGLRLRYGNYSVINLLAKPCFSVSISPRRSHQKGTVMPSPDITMGDAYWHIDSQFAQRAHVRLRVQTCYKWTSHYQRETRQEIIMWPRRHLNWHCGSTDKEMCCERLLVWKWSFVVPDKANKLNNLIHKINTVIPTDTSQCTKMSCASEIRPQNMILMFK